MHKKNIYANFDMKQIVCDCLVIMIAYLFSHQVYVLFRHVRLDFSHIWLYIIYTVIFVLSMMLMRMYNITTFYYVDRIIQKTLLSTGTAVVCIATVIFLAKIQTVSRLLFIVFTVSAYCFVILQRLFVRWKVAAKVGNGYTHILFIGDDETLEQYKGYLDKTAIKIKIDKHLYYDDSLLDDLKVFENLLMSHSLHEVVLVYNNSNKDPRISALLGICEDMGITTRLVLEQFDMPESKCFVSSIGTFPVITYHSVSFDKASLLVKMAMDVVGAAVGLVVLSPIFLIAAIAIKLESPGPVFFVQTRIGQNGKPFKMYKFRSMYKDAEERKKELMAQNKIKGAFMFKMDNDPRITKVGAFIRKTSIDELPQLVNVLKQNMSLVGTRPPTPDEVDKYNRNHWRRISIKPGITGMWQTSGRSDILDFEEVVELDKKYIDEWSVALDIKLICKTASAVLTRRGAS